jgi:hypothetical protein
VVRDGLQERDGALLLAPAPAGIEAWSLAWTVELATLARDAAQPG